MMRWKMDDAHTKAAKTAKGAKITKIAKIHEVCGRWLGFVYKYWIVEVLYSTGRSSPSSIVPV